MLFTDFIIVNELSTIFKIIYSFFIFFNLAKVVIIQALF